ncbi:MAG: cupin domain-containing protein [Promethearchaeia archaeon]
MKLYITNYKEREEIEVTLEGSEKTTMRWLVGRRSGARTYAMRWFKIEPGGIIPSHTHPEEHEIFVLSGEAKMLGDLEGKTAKKDDIIFIDPNKPHGYDNTEGTEDFRFICVIPLLDKED